MHKIFISLREWLRSLTEVDQAPDVLDTLTPSQLADLPPSHPRG